MKLFVKFQRRSLELELPADATFALLQQTLEDATQVAPRRQRILFAGAAAKRRNGPPDPGALLVDCGVSDGANLMLVGQAANADAASPVAGGSATEQPSTLAAPSMTEDPQRPTARVDRLVVQRQEGDGGLHSCSYSVGYVCQRVFVCRTCVEAGHADPAHVVCAGCAAVCHKDHEVELWGTRLNVRCDCCTTAMDKKRIGVKQDADQRAAAEGLVRPSEVTEAPPVCRFVVDEVTGDFPPLRLPPNDGNTYPTHQVPPAGTTAAATLRNGFRWCACGWAREDAATVSPAASRGRSHSRDSQDDVDACNEGSGDGESGDHDDDDDGGACEACIMCGAGYWAGHLTNLDVGWMFNVQCYGEVRGELVTFRCHTCDVDCCLPCRLHCHAEHDCGPPDLFSAEETGTDFSCGCRGGCSIAEKVDTDAASTARARAAAEGFFVARNFDHATDVVPRPADGKPVSKVMARTDVTCDGFVNFVCEGCLSQHPWLLDYDLLGGCLGDEPGKLQEPAAATNGGGAAGSAGASAASASSLGGASELMSCAFRPSAVAPVVNGTARHGAAIPRNLFSELVCQCDGCQEQYRRRIVGCSSLEAPIDLFFSTARLCGNCREPIAGACFVCVTCELQQGGDGFGGSYVLCPGCHTRRESLGHDPLHSFTEDSGANLVGLLTASLAQQMDPDAQLWMLDHWQEAQGLFFDYVRDSFGSRRLRDCDGTSSDGMTSLHTASRRGPPPDKRNRGEE